MLLQLHDNGQDISLDLYPPITWKDFQPQTRAEILDHYYAYSAGCKTPTLFGGLALASVGMAAAAFAPAIGAAAAKALGGIKIKGGAAALAATSAKDKAKQEAKKEISKGAQKSLAQSAGKAANTARQKTRRTFDSGSEKNRIVESYKRWYDRAVSNNFPQRTAQMTLQQLRAEEKKQKAILADSEKKCRKLPCDTAGCRAMGALTLRLQYVQALIKNFESSGTSTPQEYNAKFSEAINKGKTSLAGFKFGLPFLLILGAAFSLLKRK
jgi:hypothetical protein